MRAFVSPRRGACVAAVLATALVTAAAQPAPAVAQSGGCITRLPVSVGLPKGGFAAGYDSVVPVRVRARPGTPRIRNLRVQLYTFGGDLIAQSKLRPAMRSVATVNARLRFGEMQPGGFSVVVTGEPNASRSCGPKQHIRVLRFKPCITSLPVAVTNPPGGMATDYEDFLTVPLRPRQGRDGGVVTDVRSQVVSFTGEVLGSARLRAVFGSVFLNHKLSRRLTPGGYTVIITGYPQQPHRCGRKEREVVLRFR